MCGRYTLINIYGIEQRFLLSDTEFALLIERYEETGRELGPRYNIAPTQQALTITVKRRADGQGCGRQATMMRWGLVPSWTKDPKVGSLMINARAETVAERPSFRSAFRRRRCLIVADGFYEWRRDGKQRIPMRIGLKSDPDFGEMFAFAGLWETWKRPGGSEMQSCAIVTTEANDLIASIHDRMPVILDRSAESIWLDPDIDDPAVLSELLVPYPPERMTAHEVSKAVNSAAYNGPECIIPVTRLV